jgi:hypothetical protein
LAPFFEAAFFEGFFFVVGSLPLSAISFFLSFKS